MSRENVELTYRAYDALNRRDLDALLALSDPDVEFADLIVELEGGGSFRGHEGIRSWWEGYFTAFPDLSAEIDEVRDLGDLTLVRGRIRGRGMESDASFEQAYWQMIEWRNQKTVWWRGLRSEAEALEAVGLRE
jgi:ketosteroid isomerase-like protein